MWVRDDRRHRALLRIHPETHHRRRASCPNCHCSKDGRPRNFPSHQIHRTLQTLPSCQIHHPSRPRVDLLRNRLSLQSRPIRQDPRDGPLIHLSRQILQRGGPQIHQILRNHRSLHDLPPGNLRRPVWPDDLRPGYRSHLRDDQAPRSPRLLLTDGRAHQAVRLPR